MIQVSQVNGAKRSADTGRALCQKLMDSEQRPAEVATTLTDIVHKVRFNTASADALEAVRHANLNGRVPAISPRLIAEFLCTRTGDLLTERGSGMLSQ